MSHIEFVLSDQVVRYATAMKWFSGRCRCILKLDVVSKVVLDRFLVIFQGIMDRDSKHRVRVIIWIQ